MSHADTVKSSDDVIQMLRQHGLRPTRQRVDIARLLLCGGNRHVSPDSIYEELKAGCGRVAIGTVYNTLRQFCDAGLLKELHGVGDRLVYDTNTSHHHHFLDTDTGQLVDIDSRDMRVQNLPDLPSGYDLDAVEVTIRISRNA